MSVTETVVVFVGIPLIVVLVIGGLALAGGRGGSVNRYRPGRPFDFTPVWFLSRPEHLADSAGAALTAGAQAPALTSGSKSEKAGTAVPAGGTGGASDRW